MVMEPRAKRTESRQSALSAEQKIELLRTMLTIRQFEERAKALFFAGAIRGTLHLSTGQEAVAAGACGAIERGDYITSTHRGHGHCIAKGVGCRELLAEILGRATGCCHGRGGTMHVFDVARGVMGTIGVVGGGIPLATGIGLGIQQLESDRVVLCFLGDGSTNEGAFHEALNLAAVWKLPVIYIIENNLVGDTTPLREVVAIDDLAVRSVSYGMPGVVIDGNDVLAVHEAVCPAVTRARAGDGPTLIECKTYRWEGHHLGDPCVYRTKEEVEAWKQRCPVRAFKHRLIEEGVLSEAAWERMEQETQAMMDDAEAFAKGSPEADPGTVLNHVW